ncbi:MAG: Long-chain-fatty-acid--CoA ligase FadD15 [Alphaproteobacteria bacterium MarineAlpha4_Bin2]|nr:MAG: Long-chain-fatty-acid--CoA ligase FadD15 [Alphaproteobacteria bacterium MarineAlpha4_Bin2]
MDYQSIPNLVQMFHDRAKHYGTEPFLWAKSEGEWRATTWQEASATVEKLARCLASLGIEPGDRVAVVSENRPEWLLADVAIMAAGGISVPAYTTNTIEDHLHVLSDSGAKGAFVSSSELAKRLCGAAAQCPQVEFVIAIEELEPSGHPFKTLTWGAAVELGSSIDAASLPAVSDIRRDTTSCLIYTSGTSGKPKGVMLSHGAILCNCMGAHDFLTKLPGFEEGKEIFLSFLPLSHSYEHTAGQFLPISIGAQIYYSEGIEKLTGNIMEVRPTILTAVPRLYEAMHGRIVRGVEQAGGIKRIMFMKTVDLGRRRYEQSGCLNLWDSIIDGLMDRLVRSKVRGRFGGRLKAFVSGGAPLNYDIGLFFSGLGLTILQGYGMTESAPVISCNPPHPNKIHTVGPPMKDVDVRIAGDGEILVRGELVMQGYWNNPDATAETIKGGWLHTGDIGKIDEDGYIQITDRKKDIIVNSGGDNVSPQRVEGFLTVEPEIAQAMVHGDKRPHLVAIIVPDEEFAVGWAKSHGVEYDFSALVENDAFIATIRETLDRVNVGLNTIERVRRFVLTAEPFSIDNEMLTPSMKIRRHVIRAQYGGRLESLYGG